jgi:hypothetical protein
VIVGELLKELGGVVGGKLRHGGRSQPKRDRPPIQEQPQEPQTQRCGEGGGNELTFYGWSLTGAVVAGGNFALGLYNPGSCNPDIGNTA